MDYRLNIFKIILLQKLNKYQYLLHCNYTLGGQCLEREPINAVFK